MVIVLSTRKIFNSINATTYSYRLVLTNVIYVDIQTYLPDL